MEINQPRQEQCVREVQGLSGGERNLRARCDNAVALHGHGAWSVESSGRTKEATGAHEQIDGGGWLGGCHVHQLIVQ
jgi:hypothetical protein